MSRSMDSAAEDAVQQSGRAFFGKISASVSHELNNVLAIIGQTAGLLEDLLDSCPGDEPIPRASLERICNQITEQVERGARTVKRFHRFAHSVDDPRVQFEIKPTLENLHGLLQRQADLARATIQADVGSEPASLTGNPFLFQQAVFMAIQLCLTAAAENDTITVTADRQDECIVVHVEGPGCDGAPPLVLEDLMRHVGGRMETHVQDGRSRFHLAFPVGIA